MIALIDALPYARASVLKAVDPTQPQIRRPVSQTKSCAIR